jgi:3-methyladenine DNA glycosylase/8-oxoguanine DNA glycosylase
MPRATVVRVPLPVRFDLELTLFGHGWIDLAPHRWVKETRHFHSVIAGADVDAWQKGRVLHVSANGKTKQVCAGLTRMLRLDQDLSEFWSICKRDSALSWVPRRGAGRLLASPTLFEDLTKLLMTTNCTWAVTRNMASNLVGALGQRAPSGNRAFPDAAVCAKKNASFYRDVVRMGYRAQSMVNLARGFASGKLDADHFEDPTLSTDEVRERLLELDGFGPYAAGQALRLLGRYDDLALDSWCRATYAKHRGKKKPPSDRTIAREYKRFGSYQGLALWMDLTAPWHGEGRGQSQPILNRRRERSGTRSSRRRSEGTERSSEARREGPLKVER